MMTLEEFLTNYVYLFLLIFIRYIGLFLITPILGSELVLSRLKIGLSFLTAIITFPVIYNLYVIEYPVNILVIVSDVVRELSVGILIGFVVFLVFSAVQLAGEFVDLKMGFRIANVMDPLSGQSSSIMGQFKNVMAILLFLAINGHLILIRSLFYSFKIIEPGQAILSNNQIWQFIFRKTGDIFLLGFQIALPIIGTVFMIDVILGFLARSVPQMNIFIVGLPIKILMGILILYLSLHIGIYFLSDVFQVMFEDIVKIINMLG